MGDLSDRRARKKALTREGVRAVARRLFAEHGFDAVTIADIARQADVAVQTVFNHFPTKEDLFFDGRVPWVEGPAEAVRTRAPGVPPLAALRSYVVDLVEYRIGSLGDSERRCLIATIEGSPTLRAKEQDLVVEGERRLCQALIEAWDGAAPQFPADLETAARLIAALWTATARVLIIEQRPRVTAGADPADTADELRLLGDWVLRQLEFSLGLTTGAAELPPAEADPRAETRRATGWPPVAALRAG